MVDPIPPLLRAIRNEATNIAPDRSRLSDGMLGDLAHQAQGAASDHNRGARGLCHAVDITHDPPTFDAHARAEDIRQRCYSGDERRVKYLVSNDGRDRIASTVVKLTPGAGWMKRWQWRRQSGNSHASHLHISILSEPWVEQSTASIFELSTEEVDVLLDGYQWAVTPMGVPALPEFKGREPIIAGRMLPDGRLDVLGAFGARIIGGADGFGVSTWQHGPLAAPVFDACSTRPKVVTFIARDGGTFAVTVA